MTKGSFITAMRELRMISAYAPMEVIVRTNHGSARCLRTSATWAKPVRSVPGVEYPPAGNSEGNGPTPWANAISTRIPNQNSGIE